MHLRPSTYKPRVGSRSYPSFSPHITLVTFPDLSSPITLDALLGPLRISSPPPVHFGPLQAGESYLGALSIAIQKTSELMELHEKIVRSLESYWKIKTKSRGFPHMSLFYVDEADERLLLRQGLANSRLVQSDDNGRTVALCYDPQIRPMKGFVGEEIWLVDCTSNVVGEWKVMERKLMRS